MKKYYVQKCWRAIGACEFDVFHRDTKRQLTEIDTVGAPEGIFAVIDRERYVVIADCYCRADANKVRDALNRASK